MKMLQKLWRPFHPTNKDDKQTEKIQQLVERKTEEFNSILFEIDSRLAMYRLDAKQEKR